MTMSNEGNNDFFYGEGEPQATNLQPRAGAKDRQDESDKMQAQLRDASGHVSSGLHEAGPDGRGAEFDRNFTARPLSSTGVDLTDLKGREEQHVDIDKPALKPRDNYVAPAGVGSGSVRPNTPDGKIVDGIETLDD
jgi:hypothetical protein